MSAPSSPIPAAIFVGDDDDDDDKPHHAAAAAAAKPSSKGLVFASVGVSH